MKLNHWMIFAAFLAFTFGSGFLLIPAQMMDIFGVSSKSNEVVFYMDRMFGAGILGLGGMSWMAKGLPESKALRAIVLALFIYFTLGSICTLFFCLQGVANFMIWFVLGFHIPLAIALGYFLLAGQWDTSACNTNEKRHQAG
ncbi:MAG: hypothetical protein D3922_17150 [Candidatus Electrothrix sp. AR1]|nr:hypothetical protein [Candidatus Electrothrix sp. AR1]